MSSAAGDDSGCEPGDPPLTLEEEVHECSGALWYSSRYDEVLAKSMVVTGCEAAEVGATRGLTPMVSSKESLEALIKEEERERDKTYVLRGFFIEACFEVMDIKMAQDRQNARKNDVEFMSKTKGCRTEK